MSKRDGQPGQDGPVRGPMARAFTSAVRGNSTAFGFSIMITVSFGALQLVRGAPDAAELFLFAVAAACSVAGLEAAVTRGFRDRAQVVPAEIMMLGTAQAFLSVAAGIGATLGLAHAVTGVLAWPAGAFGAVIAFICAEAAELRVADKIQARRGDPAADN